MGSILQGRAVKLLYNASKMLTKLSLRSSRNKFRLSPSSITSFSKINFHTSVVINKKRKDKEEKRLLESGDVSNLNYVSRKKRKFAIDIWENMTVAELAKSMNQDPEVIFEIMLYVDGCNNYTEPDSPIDNWTALCSIVDKAGLKYRIAPKKKSTELEDKDVYVRPPPDPRILTKRPPVVTIMGHVDHGKTTLLDTLRNTSVVKSEFGGITQHIGAFSVDVNESDKITFLDTPGHAAFTSMRSRGANCTDIVVLVVAADDGVMEQTIESIRMAKEAKVPIIVAINKIDKPGADIERTKKMLMMEGIIVEDLGGDIQSVPISALKGTNISTLTEAIITQAELMEIRGDSVGPVEGVVIESKLDPHRGNLSTALVRRGTLRVGAILTAGVAWAKVRVMYDNLQRVVEYAPPSTPVEVVGWRDLPQPGDIIIEVDTERRAKEVVEYREKKMKVEKAKHDLVEIDAKREEHLKNYKANLVRRRLLGPMARFRRRQREKETISEDNPVPKFALVLKADVEGSLEAVLETLVTYNSPLCKLDIVHYGVGNVTVSDVQLAESFDAVVYNFNVGCLPNALSLANEKNIPIRDYNVIYSLIDDIKEQINQRLPQVEAEEIIGEAEVLQLFIITNEKKKKVPVAGARCLSGELKKSLPFKLIRDNKVIHRGTLDSLFHLKNEVTTIKNEQECGLRFVDDPVVFERGDKLQCYTTYLVPQFITWDPFK